eukprot:5923602-Heterocapsa_arctica.AAC.1
MAADIQNICSYTRWQSPGAWKTNMTKQQIGQLTQWMRSRNMTPVDTNNALGNDSVFSIKEHHPDKREKEAQNRMYDALTDGHHGHRIERETARIQ